ncbi:rRNA maturation RNase YbeY [Bythopirellula goksoeyrii]|uniref:Endoribonuclease YbeY n=1 Tax=Bythopirellula goksoeyrii TaxID=1400387 RepID=A0A5B9QJL6_9BACT|nr:rRNA maturation RNase YbeY [Bythopirellula goksoeyrii]QEG34293.1 Endoribonuclease YbeY [Bythopirellula goksoeyrii]
MNETGTEANILEPEEVAEGESEPAEPSFRVVVANEQSSLAIDEARLVTAVEAVLADSSYPTASISIAVVDDPTIHALNVEFLNHDYSTDVLSFVLEDSRGCLEGELIVSTDTAIREAAEAGWSSQDELLLYAVHGALHLVGYCDKQSNTQAEMLSAELKYLRRLGIALPRDASRWEHAAEDVAGQSEELLP